jgi:hypothetical protein
MGLPVPGIDKRVRRAAVQGAVQDRMEGGRRIVDVYGGQLVFDGLVVTLTRSLMPRGTVTFRATDVRAVEWRDAGRIRNGEVRFVVPGASDRPQTGGYHTRTADDERARYGLTFTGSQAASVRSLCEAVQAAAAGGAVPRAGSDPDTVPLQVRGGH